MFIGNCLAPLVGDLNAPRNLGKKSGGRGEGNLTFPSANVSLEGEGMCRMNSV